MPFFSSVVLRIILRVVPSCVDELLPLPEEEEVDEDEDVCIAAFGSAGSGIR
jgi:hypothetical protein